MGKNITCMVNISYIYSVLIKREIAVFAKMRSTQETFLKARVIGKTKVYITQESVVSMFDKKTKGCWTVQSKINFFSYKEQETML